MCLVWRFVRTSFDWLVLWLRKTAMRYRLFQSRSARYRIAVFRSIGKLMIIEFLEDMILDNLRVRAASEVIMLCGGKMNGQHSDPPISLRDTFSKIVDSSIWQNAGLIKPEDTNAYFVKSAMYDDFLKFETDLAQLCELIILFSESEGSFAELGTFVSNPEISAKLLVVIQDQYFNDEQSYIRIGPLQVLLNIDKTSVFTINDGDLGITKDLTEKRFAEIDIEKFKERIREPLRKRFKTARKEHTTFDRSRDGHIIKMLTGFVQEFGALELHELELCLQHVGVAISKERLTGYLLCAKSVQWLAEERKGDREFYFSSSIIDDSAQITLSGKQLPKDKLRRRILIQEHWKSTDVDRFRSITEVRENF